MTLAYSDILITLFVVGAVLYAAHRLGQANPIGTGSLARRLGAVELKVAEQGEKIDNLDGAVKVLAESSALTAKEMGAMRIELAADRGLGERTWISINRMETFFIDEGLRARKEG